MTYDAAIVGGGPAGAWCATRLGSGGLQVALIDGSHPREKPCGGGVTARALALVEDDLAALPSAVPIRSATFSQGAQSVALDLRADHLKLGVIARRDFDARLLARAANAVTLIPSRARNIERAGSTWRIATDTGEIAARWLIGADGAGSMVRKRVSQPFDRRDISIACGYYVHGLTSDRIDILFVSEPAGYLWSFPRRDHLAVGVCAQADGASTATLMPIVDRWIEANADGGRLERYSWPIPSLTVAALEQERPAGEGWMLIGDAAGMVDPITREGIFFALQSAESAAASILEGRSESTRYSERVRESIYSELRLAARLKARFYRPAFLALLIKALERSSRIRDVMADLVAGEQPYHSLRRRLLKTVELRLMLELAGLRIRD